MLCPSCHTQNRDNARFCKGCGLPLNGEPPAPPEQALSEQPAGTASTTAPVPQVVSTPAPSQPAEVSAEQSSNGNHIDEDVSQIPTQLLTQEQMLTYHKRKWEQDLAREQQVGKASGQLPAQDIAEQPTILYPPDLPATPAQQPVDQEQPQDIAELPTISTAPVSPDSDAHQEAAAPSTTNVETASDQPVQEQPEAEPAHQATDETVTPADQASPLPGQQEEVMEQTTPSTEKTAQAATNTEQFPVLETGSIVNGRYEISQLINSDQHEHTYQVTDRQGYQRCWNCGSEENSEGDDFCIDCGANLHDAQYIMHEYPASAGANSDSNVLSGTIVNTFLEQDRTYVIEQPQAAQLAFPNGVHLLAASDSDAGDVRRSEPNEDSTLILQFARIHESQSVPAGIFVVADGMGGHDNGQVASRMTISQIAQRITQELLISPLSSENAGEQVQQRDEESFVTLVRRAVEDANTVLCQTNQRDKTDMGSTLTGFMIVGDHAYIFNVGDSRTYMLREGNLYQLTTDHSLVGQLVASGMIEPDEVYTHPQRNQIFRSIGDKLNVQIDIFKQQVHPGDILLSCSDGLWEMVRNPQITDILMNTADPQNTCTQLIEAANTNGGEDNVSAVVVYVR